jgi:CheY-like chemotaxis protein
MTALDDEVILKQAEQLGCVAYLRKPFGADLLIEAIVRVVGHPHSRTGRVCAIWKLRVPTR